MTAASPASNLEIYNAADVASHYAGLHYLTPCERVIFDNYLRQGMAILDLGVGGGRTTPYLSSISSRYIGVDYAETMIQQCRRRFPHLDFVVADGSRLQMFRDGSFDAVVMAFNAVDYVIPNLARHACLAEIRRVLKPGGLLIFSSHNPRSVLVRPGWNRNKVRELARRLSGNSVAFFRWVLPVISALRISVAGVHALTASLARVLRRLPTRAFWRGDGYLLDPAHGGLLTHYWTPDRAEAELARHGFHILGTKGDDYPAPSHRYITDWYYYVAQKDA
jgi:ubiquinone/menaquinone biosynthesis C-methylase UbiE